MPTIGSKSIGSSVFFKRNGERIEFLVVHQGKPSALYDESCNATWLLSKEALIMGQWDATDNDYENSEAHSYLNGSFFDYIESGVRSVIKTVKIPYRKGTGSGGTTKTGASGLSTKIFLLSGYEVGVSTNDVSSLPVDGSKLDYFYSGTTTQAKNRRMAKTTGGYDSSWLLRSANINNTNETHQVQYSGIVHSRDTEPGGYFRVALVFDSSILVNDNGDIVPNTAPSTPPSITVPESIMGGTTIDISWEASTDPDNNLSGYKAEKSTNGGTSWTQIYQGPATTTPDSVASGTTSVMYRVKAYDSAGAESGYKTSAQVTVINNQPPSTPPSITVPAEVHGGSTITITWTASTDPDGNLSGYKLERSVNGEAFAQINEGTGLSFTDTITAGWTKVQYRVKAYDPYVSSGYATSNERLVINNTPPTVSCSYASGSDLGTKTSGFTINYSVYDADTDDSITVTEKIDNVVIRTYTAIKEATQYFTVTGLTFQKVLNGSHTMTIEASDGKATTKHTLTFTKLVNALEITLSTPMDSETAIAVCVINVNGNIPADAVFSVKVTNNAKDTSPVWEDCTSAAKQGQNYVFTNQSAANGFSFNFKVTAQRGASNIGGYITSIQGGFQ